MSCAPRGGRVRSTDGVELRQIRSRCRHDDPDRDPVEEPPDEEAREALRRQKDDRAGNRGTKRREQQAPAPVPVGEMTREKQRADDTDRVHRVYDRDHEHGEVVTCAVEAVERTGHGGERHHRQKRE